MSKLSFRTLGVITETANLFPPLFSVLLLCAAIAAQSSPNEQLPAGPAKEKADAACLTCHEARIIVQQRLTKPAWIKEVDKMTKWGAEVDPKDRDGLIDYFSANFGPDQPTYVAPKTAAASGLKAGTGQQKHEPRAHPAASKSELRTFHHVS